MPSKKLIKVVDSENESEVAPKEEKPKEQSDMIFNFGKYKNMRASDVIQIKQFKADKIIYIYW